MRMGFIRVALPRSYSEPIGRLMARKPRRSFEDISKITSAATGIFSFRNNPPRMLLPALLALLPADGQQRELCRRQAAAHPHFSGTTAHGPVFSACATNPWQPPLRIF
jgi:hypothetical protein